MAWSRFMDMYSGGGAKLKDASGNEYEYIYIEETRDKASLIFYNRFDRDPSHVTCSCCGEDYSVSEYSTLEQASVFERHCKWDSDSGKYVEEPEHRRYVTLEEYIKGKDILIIRAEDIHDYERLGKISKNLRDWDE